MLQYQYISALFDCGIRCSLPPLNQNLMFPSAVCIFFCSVLDLKKKKLSVRVYWKSGWKHILDLRKCRFYILKVRDGLILQLSAFCLYSYQKVFRFEFNKSWKLLSIYGEDNAVWLQLYRNNNLPLRLA